MRLIASLGLLTASIFLTGCLHKGANPDDPYESFNRKVHGFNLVFDRIFLKPPARLYRSVLPAPVRASVNNFYNNIYMLPTIGNDLLQGEWHYASNDAGRLVINSVLGIGGLFDVANGLHLPLRRNDLGLTFAKWGDKHSPYIVIPFLGPSTIRDGMGLLFEYTFMTPYPYIDNATAINTLVILRYIDLRSQFLETENLFDEALDKYSFIRDAYLQHRNYLITGEEASSVTPESTAMDDDVDYIDE